MKNYYLSLSFMLMIVYSLNAQQYEMSLIHNGSGELALQMRETAGGANTPSTSDGLSDITFAIRWPQSCGSGISLSITSAGTAGHADYSIATAGSRLEVGTDYLQIFQTSTTPILFPENWTTNTFVTVATIQVSQTGTGTCDLCVEANDVTDNSGSMQISAPNISMGYAAGGFNVMDYLPTISSGKVTMVPLPVELLSFKAKGKDNYVTLDWASAAEIAFDGYQLERSDDGKNFKEIAWIAGAGDALTPTTYTHNDKDIIAGRTYYYRLAMRDLDNSIEHSSIEVVEIDAKFSVAAYPKPTRDILNVHVESAADTDAVLHLVDIHGRVVYEQRLEVEKGANDFTLNAKEVTNGVYFLIIRSNAWQHAEEVIFLK